MDGTNAQIASSGDHESGDTANNRAKYNAQAGSSGGSLATNAGLLTQMANI
jgi:hypothetical protein